MAQLKKLMGRRKRTHSERALFLSIWFLIFIGMGLWKSSHTPRVTTSQYPELSLSSGLDPFFKYAELRQTVGNTFNLDFELAEAWKKSAKQKNYPVQIGYELRGGQSVLETGSVYCTLPQNGTRAQVSIPNPQHFHPREIHLFLAH